MTLRRTLTLTIAAQILAVAALCAVGLWGLSSARTALDATTDQFDALRLAHRAGHHLLTARALAQQASPDVEAAHAQLRSALSSVDEGLRSRPAGGFSFDSEELNALRRALASALEEQDPFRIASQATSAVGVVQRLAQGIQRDARSRREAAIAANAAAGIQLAGAGLLIGMVSVGVGLAQHRSVMRPLFALRRSVEDVRNRRSAEAPVAGHREFRELAQGFNEMAQEILDAQESLERRVRDRTAQLIRSERLARLGALAAGFAHEISNPLAIMSGHAELALRRWKSGGGGASGAELVEALDVTLEEAQRAKRIITNLQRLGAHGRSERVPLLMSDVARKAVDLVRPIAEQRGCRLACEAACDAESTRTLGEESEYIQVLVNLLMNSVQATEAGGAVALSCLRRDDDVIVTIADDGAGIEADMLERIFDPFVSGGEGPGLGLSVCHAIAERHGARLRIASEGPGRGSVATLALPAASAEVAA